jgi:hypothetical protein
VVVLLRERDVGSGPSSRTHHHGDDSRRAREVLGAEAPVVEQDDAARVCALSVQLEPQRGERLLHLRDRVEAAGVCEGVVRRGARSDRRREHECRGKAPSPAHEADGTSLIRQARATGPALA